MKTKSTLTSLAVALLFATHTDAVVYNAKGQVVSRPGFIAVETGEVDGWMPHAE